MEGTFESKHGRRTLDVTPHNQFTLESSKNAIHSFGSGTVQRGKIRGVHSFPFHRFLILRFLNTPLSEIYEEIFQLDLLHGKVRFPAASLKKIHNRFLERLPDQIRNTVKRQIPPKSKKMKEAYDTFLTVMNIKKFYYEPELVEYLNPFMELKATLEMYLSAHSTAREIAHVIGAQMGVNVADIAVWSYRILFYSIHEINQDDLELYLSLILPQERKMKKLAIPKTIIELSVALGLDLLSETRDVLEVIRKDAQKQFFDLSHMKTSDARQARKHALDQFLKADEYIEKHGGNLVDFAKIFGKFVIEKAPDGVISIEDIRSEEESESKSG